MTGRSAVSISPPSAASFPRKREPTARPALPAKAGTYAPNYPPRRSNPNAASATRSAAIPYSS